MSIYTKAGDRGFTSTINRKNIPKNSPIFSVLGTLDEASSALGTAKPHLEKELAEKVDRLQKDIFSFNGELAGAEKFATAEKIRALEQEIDSITSRLGENHDAPLRTRSNQLVTDRRNQPGSNELDQPGF